MTIDSSRLLEPGSIGTMKLKNRIVMAPMGTFLSDREGRVTQPLVDHYEARARGGVGLVISEATFVDPSGRNASGKHEPSQLGIHDDNLIPGLSELTRAIQKHGAKVAIQLNHAGHTTRAEITGQQPLGPSAEARPGYDRPKPMTMDEIQWLTARFVEAARRAQKAGFDGVELHGGHHYIFAQFLSPTWNKRSDSYGGSLQNRARFLLETITAIKGSLGASFPVWCRLNAVGFLPEGDFPPEECRAVAQMVEAVGADAVHISAWAGYAGPHAYLHRVPMSEPRGLLLPFSEGVKRVVKIPVIAVGSRFDLTSGEKALREGQVDFVAMGRALIADPALARKAASGQVSDVRPCLACNACLEHLTTEGELICSVNPTVATELEHAIKPADRSMRVLVLGGGPAGMQAACVAALRGHRVTLWEQHNQLGGMMLLGALPPHKETIRGFTQYLVAQVDKLRIQVELSKKATFADVEAANADVLVLATGTTPLIPNIPGINRQNVVTAIDVLNGKASVGQQVVVIGGELVGCETAEFLAESGRLVTITRRGTAMATGVGASVRYKLFERLDALLVKRLVGVRYREITDRGLCLTTEEGLTKTIAADTIVLAAGARPNRQLLPKLISRACPVHVIGDCDQPGTIREAVASGYRLARAL